MDPLSDHFLDMVKTDQEPDITFILYKIVNTGDIYRLAQATN